MIISFHLPNYVGRYTYDADGHGATPNVPYVKMADTDTMVQGQGYWIISDTDKTWTIPTTIGDAATQTAITAWPAGAVQPPTAPHSIGIPTRNDLAGIFPYDLVPLLAARTAPVATDPTNGSDNRMMFSNPFSSAVDWSDTLMEVQTTQSFLDDSGLPNTPTAALAFALNLTGDLGDTDRSAYVYDPTTGDYITIAYATPGLARGIKPGEVFFLRISNFSVSFMTPILELAVSK
ncbi:hypothetical protein [Methyloprofundus sp.]|uniref:hypothetical protein n=1 Tax=Methyloprofundus sp. TaxID=2020875 RepID=UPI003D0B7947